jgi:hypothetical protein
MHRALLDGLRAICNQHGRTLDESPAADLIIPLEGGEELRVPMTFIRLQAEREQL